MLKSKLTGEGFAVKRVQSRQIHRAQRTFGCIRDSVIAVASLHLQSRPIHSHCYLPEVPIIDRAPRFVRDFIVRGYFLHHSGEEIRVVVSAIRKPPVRSASSFMASCLTALSTPNLK